MNKCQSELICVQCCHCKLINCPISTGRKHMSLEYNERVSRFVNSPIAGGRYVIELPLPAVSFPALLGESAIGCCRPAQLHGPDHIEHFPAAPQLRHLRNSSCVDQSGIEGTQLQKRMLGRQEIDPHDAEWQKENWAFTFGVKHQTALILTLLNHRADGLQRPTHKNTFCSLQEACQWRWMTKLDN